MALAKKRHRHAEHQTDRMKNCPSCAQPLGELDVVCRSCGHAVPSDAAPVPQVRVAHQEQQRQAKATSTQGTRGNRWPLMGLMPAAAVGGVAGVILLVVMSALQGRNGATRSAGVQADAEARAVRVSSTGRVPGAVPIMKWNQVKQSPWGRDGIRTVAFELAAEGDVPVWMKRVRPLLVVRCLSRNTEVFVVTSSAASFERNSGRHTVHIGFDEGGETAQEWEDSVDSQQLFAPDGVGLARRIADARKMTFRFTPFNASPVTAEFHVAGFSDYVQTVAKTCRWRP